MRIVLAILTVILAAGFYVCGRIIPTGGTTRVVTSEGSSASVSARTNSTVAMKVEFATQIRPILETKCQPCHFSGGKVYERLPFDRPETIKTLGTKLFTRIKDEDKRRIIREFLAQN